MTDDGQIGEEIWNIATALHFYIGLETKEYFSYEKDNGRYIIQVQSKCGSSRSEIDLKGLFWDLICVTWCNMAKSHNVYVATYTMLSLSKVVASYSV